MEESSTPEKSDQPFSVLERFRQLRKHEEQPKSSEENSKTSESSGTIFQASTSSQPSPNGEFNRGGRRGRFPGKRRFYESSCERPSKRVAGDAHKGQKEVDCGITEYLREGPGFDVIIKSRYTDFQVNEIDCEGNVVRLTSTDVKLPFTASETLSEEEDPTIMSPENWDALRNIVDNRLSTTVDIDVTDFTKEQRQRIHKAVKQRFGIHIFSNTNDIDGKKMMQIGSATGRTDYRFCMWPKDRPEYLHFVLFKENVDMSDAISTISRYTHIKPGNFGYAGTKDKRAITIQRVSVRRGDVEKFRSCQTLRGIAVGNFCYKWKNLRLGDLSGNRFKLVLRNIKASNEVIEEAVEHIEKNGFINYFGLQRFGTSALVPTYCVGKAVLSGDWKSAVELILKPRPGEATFRDVMEARDIWWETRNASDALKKLSRKDKSIEGKVLIGLRKHGPNAYQNAFDNLPRQIGTMYLHSYQSLIWNRVISRRVKQFTLKVLPGDLVKVSSEEAAVSEHVETKTDDDKSKEEDDEEDAQALTEFGEGRIQVRALTEQEAAEASIYDVYYPLPGDDIQLPANEVANWYTELLQEDGFSMSCFGNVHKKYGMYGSYRLMLEKPGDVTWKTVNYTDPDQDLQQTELSMLRQEPPPPLDPEGPYKALVLEFSLKVCCYATMAVRELTKCDTSTNSQALLSLQAREEDKKHQESPTKSSVNGNTSTETEPQLQTDEQGEMITREAMADNIINKFLEINYH